MAPVTYYANQVRRPWRPESLYKNLPRLASMYGMEANGDEEDPQRQLLERMGSERVANGPASTRSAEISARLGARTGNTTSNLKSMIPSEASALLTSGANKNFSSPYMSQLSEIGKFGEAATAVVTARNAWQRAQQAANPPSAGGGGGGFPDLGGAKGARAQAIKNAYTQIGVPYVWGGTSPGRGFDCSGLVQWAYGKAGIKLPRVSQQQMTRGRRTPLNKLQPGDLVGRGNPATHIAIWLGGGKILEAQKSGTRIHTRNIGSGAGWWGIHLNI